MSELQRESRFPALKYFGPANAATSLVIVIGFLSAVLLAAHYQRSALTLLAITVVLDRLDGLLARRFNDVTPLGEQLDSLADATSFCFLPAFAAYLMGFNSVIAMVLLSLYVLSGLWRLAYFNLTHLQKSETGAEYFLGIPTTICASWFVVALMVRLHLPPQIWTYLMYPFFLVGAVAMVSTLRYRKNGVWTKLLYGLVPLAIVGIWV